MNAPYCECCGVELGQDLLECPDTGNTFCGLSCRAEYEQSRAEAAWERYLDRYYGGEIKTEREQYVELWHEKQGWR
jgi:hypothetical protein